MKLKKYLIHLLLIVIIAGCSSSAESTNTKKVTPPSTAFYSSNKLNFELPKGWREIKDNHEQLFDIWLVNDSNNAVIGFIPIHLNENINLNSIDEKLDLIEKIIREKRISETSEFEIIEEKRIVSNYPIRMLKFKIENITQNSLLFGNDTNFYECLAYFKKGYEPTWIEFEDLLNVQMKTVSESSIK